MKNLILSVLLLTAAAPNGAWSGEGSGVRGGEVVFIDGKYVNRDFLESSEQCWVSGGDVAAGQPGVARILNAVARVDWYFAMTIEKKLNSLEFCFGGPLKRIEIDTRHSPREEIYSSVFVALQNDKGHVYEDENLFNRISDPVLNNEDARGMHLIHEAIHPLISSGVPDGERRESVFLALSTIRKLYLGRLTSRKELHKNLSLANLMFPLTVSYLDPFKSQIQFLSGDSIQRSRIFFSNTKLDVLLNNKLPTIVVSKLASSAEQTAAQEPIVTLASFVEEVFESGTATQLDYVMDSLEYTLIDVNSLAFGSYASLSPDRQAELLTRISAEEEFSKALVKMSLANVTVQDGRLVPNAGLVEFSQKREGTVIELRPLTPQSSVPVPFRSMVYAVKMMLEKEQKDVLAAALASDTFYDALNLKNAAVSIAISRPRVAREKTYSLERIEDLKVGVVTVFRDFTKAVLTASEFETVSKLIQWNRLAQPK